MKTLLSFLRALIIVPLFCITSFTLFAQVTQFTPGYTWRHYEDGCGVGTRLCHYYPMNGPNFTNNYESKFEEFTAWRNSSGAPNVNTASSFLNFRVSFPANYDPNREEPYPIIMFLHGGGEAGRIGNCCGVNWGFNDQRIDNNSHQLYHGGIVHTDALARDPSDPRAFPGILIYPQASYGASWYDADPSLDVLHRNQIYLAEIIAYMAQNYKGDINRVYLHGLSLGAKGVWDTATKLPDLFAAILPMSGISTIRSSSVEVLQTTPIWQFQGGRDVNPVPNASLGLMNDLNNIGANPIYTVYPNLGHGTWNTAYNEPDFFAWMLRQDKRNIYVYGDKVWGGTFELANGGGNSKKLGFSAGFTAYQWKKNGVIIPGATTRFYTVTGTGNYAGQYTVDFKRPGDNTWYSSFPVTITSGGGSAFVPELTVSGSLIRPFTNDTGGSPGLINTTAETHLITPAGYAEYRWYRDGILQAAGGTSNEVVVTHGAGTGNPANLNFNNQGNQANSGNWQVSVLLPSGYWSDLSVVKTLIYPVGVTTHSQPVATGYNVTGDFRINITNGAPTGSPSRPIATALSDSEIKITWGQWPQYAVDIVEGETHFEIWRKRNTGTYPFDDGPQSNGGFVMVGTAPADAIEFIDTGLRPNAPYLYMVRPVTDTDGRFSRTSANGAPNNGNPTTTLNDTQAPTPPADLVVTNIQSTSISISWSPATDNDVVNSYEVYNGATQVASISAVSYYTENKLWSGSTTYVIGDTVFNSPPNYPNSLFVARQNANNVEPGVGSWTSGWSIVDRDLTNDVPPVNTYTFTNLEPGTTYTLNVRAKDFMGNQSPFAPAVVATTTTNGLNFSYYVTTGLSGNNTTNTARQLQEPYTASNGPNFDFSTATPNQMGTVANFNISGAVTFQGTSDPNNFVYAFDGYIQVPSNSNYRFFTRSDDGSRMYLNGSLIINNDGSQGATNANSNSIPLTAGTQYPIRVTYFANSGGQELNVRYTSGGSPSTSYNSSSPIPDSWLYPTNTTVTIAKAGARQTTDEYLTAAIENPETGVFHPYPNPTSGILHLELNPATSKYNVHLLDALGKTVNATITPIDENKVEIDLTELPPGMYIVSANGFRYRVIRKK